jgi:protein O-mannosyl-transferase
MKNHAAHAHWKSMKHLAQGNRLAFFAAAAAILVVAIVYWPVVHANFVWIDWTDFHDRNWLRDGYSWKHYILRDFNGWTNYFRPLVVGFFALQVHLFDTMPGPMHVVSLCLHLINTLLVGLLAWRYTDVQLSALRRACGLGIIMLLYGLHPVLIEPVAWIGCQFELLVTMFTLLSLLADSHIQQKATRTVVLATLFFLAACTKESAVSLPMILVIFQWLQLPSQDAMTLRMSVRQLLLRNGVTYIAIVVAGIAYLIFRHWALGTVVNPFPATPIPAFARLQEICFLYLHYWRMLVWPMYGMSPIHPIDTSRFNAVNLSNVLTDLATIGILLVGSILALKRRSALGCMVLAVTFALLPVLRVASVDFDPSLYHERYAMIALAIVCIMLPQLPWHLPENGSFRRLIAPLLSMALLFWLSFAVINIRVTLPLWANDLALWRWALVEYPQSTDAMNNLLSAYVQVGDRTRAHELSDRLQSEHANCADCLLNAAFVAISENDSARAAAILETVRHSRTLAYNKNTYLSYLYATGLMLLKQGRLDDAVQVLRTAIKVEPLAPQPKLSLATALALQGKKAEALEIGEAVIANSSMSQNEQNRQRKVLNAAIATGQKSAQPLAKIPSEAPTPPTRTAPVGH